MVADNIKARAFFNKLYEILKQSHGESSLKKSSETLALAGIRIQEIVEKLTIRDWKRNTDIQNQMENAIEDYLMEHRKTLGIEINFDEIDEILKACLIVAKNNY